MKKLLLVMVAATAFGALPPLAQNIRELKALIEDTRFYDSLGSAEVLKDIIHTDDGFLVLTTNYVMKVDVKYQNRDPKRFGPVQFELDFHSPIDLKAGQNLSSF